MTIDIIYDMTRGTLYTAVTELLALCLGYNIDMSVYSVEL
jgi:hypothetical protein